MSTLIPLNGVDICYCGGKYWTPARRCYSCGERYEPELPEPDDAITAVFDDDEPDYDGYHDAFLASMDDEAEARRWEAAHYLDTEREMHDD